MKRSFVITPMPGEYAVVRMGPVEPAPAWMDCGVFCSVTRTPEELSLLVEAAAVPPGLQMESGWRGLKLEGPFAFNQVGILAGILTPLAAAGISILAISTFDTDYVFVKNDQFEEALKVLEIENDIKISAGG
ncbi:MAG: ACT domain-containing protein [Leptolinea sp.]